MAKFNFTALTAADKTKHIAMLKELGVTLNQEGHITNVSEAVKGFSNSVKTGISGMTIDEQYDEAGAKSTIVVVNIDKPTTFLSVETGKMEEMYNIRRNGSFVDLLTDIGVDDDIDLNKLNENQKRKVLRVLSGASLTVVAKNVNNDKGWNTLHQIKVAFDSEIAERIERMYSKFVTDAPEF